MADQAFVDQIAAALSRERLSLAESATSAWFDERPDYEVRFGARGRRRCTEDGLRHLDYLAAATRVAEPEIFVQYLSWAKVLLDALRIPPDDLTGHLRHLRRLLGERLPEAFALVDPILEAGLVELALPVAQPAPFIEQSAYPELAAAFVEALVSGARQEASSAIQSAVDGGMQIEELYLEVFQPSLREIGRLWQTGKITVAEEHLATASTQFIMAQLYPKVFGLPQADRGTLLATCVAGNLHEVGVRMLADVFSLHGWQTHLLGADTPTDAVVKMAVARGADVVAVSATLIEQLDAVSVLIAALREATTATILVGGPPFVVTPSLVQAVDADGTANDARAAVALAESLMRR